MAWNFSRRFRKAVSDVIRCERITHNRLRRYIGAGLIILAATIIFLICFHILFTFILMVLNVISATIDNANRSTHSLEIQRFDDDIHVETEIDPKLEISRLFLTTQQKGCKPRNTVKDFEKGTEVFVENDYCFVRFFNHSEESYDQQMRLFQMLDGMPLQQSDDPATYEAVQHLQFTDQLYDLLGQPVSLQCNMRRLLWIFPVTPARAEQLAGCRCFDTLHARINVCLQTKDDLARRVHPWSLETTGTPTTEPTNEGTGRYPPGLDRILMKPADMGLV